MTYGSKMNKLDELAQKVWSATTLEEKKEVVLEMVASFKYRDKIPAFIRAIKAADEKTLNFMASNLALNNTDKVVGMLPR